MQRSCGRSVLYNAACVVRADAANRSPFAALPVRYVTALGAASVLVVRRTARRRLLLIKEAGKQNKGSKNSNDD